MGCSDSLNDHRIGITVLVNREVKHTRILHCQPLQLPELACIMNQVSRIPIEKENQNKSWE
jgi:hypothetical protein